LHQNSFTGYKTGAEIDVNGRLRVRKSGNGFAAIAVICVALAAVGFS